MMVRDSTGREYYDFYGGHAVALLGHCHPAVTQAISQQAKRLTFYSNVVALDVRSQAARRLCDFAPPGLDRVFFCNSGTEANENALKLAIQQTGRKRITALTGGFHGRTLLTLSATHSATLRAPFAELLCESQHLRPPPTRGDATLPAQGEGAAAAALYADVDQIDERDAAVIVEPIQSVAGVVELSDGYLEALRRRCDAVGAMLIFDEVQTGMGRLGSAFVAGACGVVPDMVTLAKSIANGLPMGAVLLSDKVASRVKVSDLGATFGGGPVACAALLAVLETIERDDLLAHARCLGELMRDKLVVGPVVKIRGRGCLIGLEVRQRADRVRDSLLKRGFLVGTSADPKVVRLMPPITAPFESIDRLADALADVGD